MVRLALTVYLVGVTAAGPWFCCCTASRFFASLTRPSNPAAEEPVADEPCCCCCCHVPAVPQQPEHSQEPSPSTPFTCPCQQNRLPALPSAAQEVSAALVLSVSWSGGPDDGWLPDLVGPDGGGIGATYEDLIAIRRRLADFDPHACRRRAERYFSHLRMARDYVRMYEGLLHRGRLPAGRPLTLAEPSR